LLVLDLKHYEPQKQIANINNKSKN